MTAQLHDDAELFDSAELFGPYPWDGNANVAGFVPEPGDVVLSGSDVDAFLSTDHQFTAVPGTDAGTWDATDCNGHPVVLFDGTDDEMFCTDPALLAFVAGDDTDCTMIWLAKILASTSGAPFLSFYQSGSHRYRLLNAGNKLRIDRGGVSGTLSIAQISQVHGAYHVLTARFVKSGTQQHLRIDRVEDGNYPVTFDVGAFGASEFGICAGSLGADYPQVNLAGFWVVKNDDVAVIDEIELWAMRWAGLI